MIWIINGLFIQQKCQVMTITCQELCQNLENQRWVNWHNIPQEVYMTSAKGTGKMY